MKSKPSDRVGSTVLEGSKFWRHKAGYQPRITKLSRRETSHMRYHISTPDKKLNLENITFKSHVLERFKWVATMLKINKCKRRETDANKKNSPFLWCFRIELNWHQDFFTCRGFPDKKRYENRGKSSWPNQNALGPTCKREEHNKIENFLGQDIGSAEVWLSPPQSVHFYRRTHSQARPANAWAGIRNGLLYQCLFEEHSDEN